MRSASDWLAHTTIVGDVDSTRGALVSGRCVLRYDNEAGKGDHRHAGEKQSPYVFSSPERLSADFQRDIARWNRENRDS